MVAVVPDLRIGTLISENLLAFLGFAGLLGALTAVVWSDQSGPAAPTLFRFFLRVAIFLLIFFSKDPLSIANFFASLRPHVLNYRAADRRLLTRRFRGLEYQRAKRVRHHDLSYVWWFRCLAQRRAV